MRYARTVFKVEVMKGRVCAMVRDQRGKEQNLMRVEGLPFSVSQMTIDSLTVANTGKRVNSHYI
jgi:hypothetical protein